MDEVQQEVMYGGWQGSNNVTSGQADVTCIIAIFFLSQNFGICVSIFAVKFKDS